MKRICICTTYGANAEPRSPRYAAALARMCPDTEVLYVDCVPVGKQEPEPADFEGLQNLRRHTIRFAWRAGHRGRLLAEKVQQQLAIARFHLTGAPTTPALSTRSIELRRFLLATPADLYGGFNIDALLPVCDAASRCGVPFFFDCQEYYSDMGQASESERATIREAERRCLPKCALTLAASEQLGARLRSDYGLTSVLALENAPPLQNIAPPSGSGFSLYWRNGTIDPRFRGLGEAIHALRHLPPEITLSVQGRLPGDGEFLHFFIRDLALSDRVKILPPYPAKDAVLMASRHTVGLCPEQPTTENLNLTTSNKLFDYMMAGLAVVGSNLAGLSDVIRRSGAGLLFTPSDPVSLAAQIHRLYLDEKLLAAHRRNAREFALREGNLEFQLAKLRTALTDRGLVHCA